MFGRPTTPSTPGTPGTATTPTVGSKPAVDLGIYRAEVEGGLQCTAKDRADAVERQSFMDYDQSMYLEKYQRTSETSWDREARPHRESGFLAECVEVLCDHLYSPGPARRFSDEAADKLLQQIAGQNHLDAMMQEADQLSTLNDACAIQIDAGDGDFAGRPLTYRLWGREQFEAFADPDNPTEAEAVVTIDKYDLRTRYRLWSKDEVWTFLTKRADKTDGGVVATLSAQEKHAYGCIPFSFVHYKIPIRSFFCSSIGTLLHRAEIRIDDRLSRIDEAIQKHLNPIAVAEGVEADWKPTVEPMRFIRMAKAKGTFGPSGGYESGSFARLYFLQATIDSAGAWEDLIKYINQVLEAAHVPLSAVRMEQQGIASGISLMVEQAPLLTRARKRRLGASISESDLARRSLICMGNHYRKPALLTAAAEGKQILTWPRPSIPIPTPDALDLIVKEVGAGAKSYLMFLQEWYSISRDDAIELVKQIGVDQADATAANPQLMAIMTTAKEEPGDGALDASESKGAADGSSTDAGSSI